MNERDAIAKYIQLRDLKASEEAAHKERLKPLNEAMSKLEAFLLQRLNEAGSDSIKSKAGTAYKSTRTSVTIADKDVFVDFARRNGLDHLLDIRASKTGVEEYFKTEEVLPPGINRTAEIVVNVRKS